MSQSLNSILSPSFFDSSHISSLRSTYEQGDPFPHVVLPNFFHPEVIERLTREFPSPFNSDDTPNTSIYHVYKNPIEDKLTCNDLSKLPSFTSSVLQTLNTPEFASLMGSITGINNLEPDPHLNGGGIHCMPDGGKLDLHLDYSLHPITCKERRINIIIYLNDDWKEEYGGALELWSADEKGDAKECVHSFTPQFNTAVVFRTSDVSFHGIPERITCPPSTYRKTMALYYVSEPRPNVTYRMKAKFVGRPTDPHNPALEKLRQIRVTRRLTEEDLEEYYRSTSTDYRS